MKYRLTIPGCLPGLNEYTKVNRSNRYQAAAMKNQTEHLIGLMIKSQLRNVEIDKQVTINYLWIEKDRRRDKDNIAFAKKFIQDAMVKTGILKNDGWKEIEGFTDSFSVDKKNPRVEVEIVEQEA